MRDACLFVLILSGCGSNHSSANNDLALGMSDLAVEGCTDDGNPCALAGDQKGLCKSLICTGCTNTTDDGACNLAYGSSTASFICSNDVCSPGCRTSTDCGGQICGLSAPNTCAACTADAQCQAFNDPGTICEISTGKCVSNTCTTISTACTANAADVCCAATGGNACTAGTCCTTADCGSNTACIGHQCTTCPSPSPGLLVVDPTEAATSPATGADVAGCRFNTITEAVATSPPPGTTIRVIGSANVTGDDVSCPAKTGECFPIRVPTGVTILGDATMKPTILVSQSFAEGFLIGLGGVRLSNLIIDGANNGGHGIELLAPTTSPSPIPQLDNVTVQNFIQSGVQVSYGMLNIRGGVVLTNNEIGLELVNPSVVVDVSTTTSPITFNGNSDDGVKVEGGALKIVGTAGTSGAGTVQINEGIGGNGNGVEITAAPATGAAATTTLDGIALWHNIGSGVRMHAGTPLKMRNCYALHNVANGVEIISASAISSATMALIDLGRAVDGKNTLQKLDIDFANQQSGICINAPAASDSPVLQAQGNYFLPSYDCTTTPSPGPVTVQTPCDDSSAVGVDHSGYSFNLAQCTL